uniref:Hemicentin-1 n=1 Tax=Magallana gigas TaxID=29159 RepID=A0A8W8NFL9_MAGGI
MIRFVVGITLTVHPSNIVEVNEQVTLQCALDRNPSPPVIVMFSDGLNTLCTVEPDNGVCKNTTNSCVTRYNGSCTNEIVFSIQVNVPLTWNGKHLSCKSLYSNSNSVNFTVIVPVKSVTLTPNSITVVVGQQINLTCTTSYCNPPANISWYKSSTDITSQSTSTRDKSGGLVRTASSLQTLVFKMDNEKQVYCAVSNIPGRSVISTVLSVAVWYKPEVTSSTQNPYKVTEGQTTFLECLLTDANPRSNITWQWYKTGSSTSVLYNRPVFYIANIKRKMSGSYSCTASNSIGTSVAFTIYVDVLYKPEVTSSTLNPYKVTEGQAAILECRVTAANPSSNITWQWYKTDRPGTMIHNGPTLRIPNIQRNRSGSYSCTASNSVGTSEVVDINIDVQYRPDLTANTPSPYKVIEGEAATLKCRVTAANPNSSITWSWYKTDNPSNVLYNGSTLSIQHIQRDRSGLYHCTASNSVGTSLPVNTLLDVQYKPEILDKPSTLVNESENVILFRTIVSNPLADVYWYRGQQLLQSQLLVRNTTYIIEKASCADATNFTLVASNEVERNVTALVELLVNCKPSVANSKVTLGVTDTAVLNFSVIVIAFPEPQYELNYINGTSDTQMMHTITRNTMNNFSINFNQKTVNKCDCGTYHLKIWNLYGETTIIVNIFIQRKPDNPRNIGVTCEATRATVQWISSFNGGDHQTFDVFALNGQQGGNQSIQIPDMGENKIHKAYVQNLQPSMAYVFYVSAQNNYGFSISNIISCMTSKETTNSQTGTIAGSVAGILLLITIVILIVFLIQKRYVCDLTIHKRNSKEANKESSFYTAITEQQENRERNMYDELTKDENRSQYEAVLMTEKQGHNEKLYEEMQKSRSEDFESQSNSKDRKTILKGSVDERCLEQDVEEYANTSFKD